jgi:hypothetical protein
MRIALLSLPIAIITLLGSFAAGTEETTTLKTRIIYVAPLLEAEKSVVKESKLQVTIDLLTEATTPYLKMEAINKSQAIHTDLTNQTDREMLENVVTPILRELALSKSVDIRLNAVKAIPVLVTRNAFDCLEPLLEEEKDEEVLLLAGQMLGKVATRGDLLELLPYFEKKENRGLQIAIATAWLESTSRTGMPFEQSRVEKKVLPTLMEIMESPRTSIRHHRIAHQLETKLRNTYGIGSETPAKPVYGIAQ